MKDDCEKTQETSSGNNNDEETSYVEAQRHGPPVKGPPNEGGRGGVSP